MQLLFILFICFCFVQSKIGPLDRLLILEEEGFLSYHIPDKSNFGQLKKCSVNFMGLTYQMDLESSDDYVGTLDSGEKIRRFSKSVCGIRVENVTKNSNGKWILIANGTNNEEENAIANIIVLSKIANPPDVSNLTVSSTSVYIECPFDETKEYCEIIDGRGKVIEDKCYATSSNRLNERSWTCRTLVRGSQELRVNHYNIDFEKTPVGFNKKVFEDDNSLILSCLDTKFSNCIADGPNDKMLLLHEGLASTKYSSYDTNQASGICSLEFRKPIDPNDMGIWRIVDVQNVKHKKGCVFKVGDSSTSRSLADVRHKIDVDVARTSVINLVCEYPGEIEYCFIQDPELNLKYLTGLKLDGAQDLGICDFDVTPLAGEWVCGMKPANSKEIQQTYYDMRLFNNYFIQTQPAELTKKPKKEVKLKCQTVLDYSIKYCNFKSPLGQWYSVDDNTTIENDSRITYWGQGLDMGDCGITIKDPTDDDYGSWMCSIQLIGSSSDGVPQTATIMLHHPEGHATAIGLGVAIGVILLSVVVFMVFRVRRVILRNRQRRNDQNIVQMIVED